MTFGEQILYARRRAGLTQEALSKAAGLHGPSVIDIERNRIPITKEGADRILAVIASLAEQKMAAA
jgi:transcriptional regulator with XRE-family HTH domain